MLLGRAVTRRDAARRTQRDASRRVERAATRHGRDASRPRRVTAATRHGALERRVERAVTRPLRGGGGRRGGGEHRGWGILKTRSRRGSRFLQCF